MKYDKRIRGKVVQNVDANIFWTTEKKYITEKNQGSYFTF